MDLDEGLWLINIYRSDRFTCWLDCLVLRWITNSHIKLRLNFFLLHVNRFKFQWMQPQASLDCELSTLRMASIRYFFVVRMQLELNCKFVGKISIVAYSAQFYGANGEHRGVCMRMVINYFATTTMLLQGRFTLYVDWDYVRACGWPAFNRSLWFCRIGRAFTLFFTWFTCWNRKHQSHDNEQCIIKFFSFIFFSASHKISISYHELML